MKMSDTDSLVILEMIRDNAEEICGRKGGEAIRRMTASRKFTAAVRRVAAVFKEAKTKETSEAKQSKPVSDDKVAKLAEKQKKARTAPNVGMSDREVTLNVATFAIKQAAEQDAKMILSDGQVTRHRTLVFPRGGDFGVQPNLTHVKVVPLAGHISDKWAVRATIEVIGGDEAHRRAYIGALVTKTRSMQDKQ